MSALLFIIFSGCASDYSVKTFEDPEVGEDTSPPPVEEEAEPIPPPPEECPERIWAATEVAIDESCFIPPEIGLFNPVVEWQMSNFDEYPGAIISFETPIVGNLSDDNGDGLINDDDIPDIVTSMQDMIIQNWCGHGLSNGDPNSIAGVLRVISGDGSAVHWSIRDVIIDDEAWLISGMVNAAIGDIDNDGLPEIVTGVFLGPQQNTLRIVAFNHLGELEWWTESFTKDLGQPVGQPIVQVALGDIDTDGNPEVFAGDYVFNGEDGSLQFQTFDAYNPLVHFFSFPADLEKDGQVEVINRSGIFDAEGNQRCSFVTTYNGRGGGPAVGDIDGDGIGNVVHVNEGFVTLYDHTCHLLTWWDIPDYGKGGPPTIADYDGDGAPEIGIASYDNYYVFETDGTILWTHEISDRTSNMTGSAVFDFEGDGYSEVVYAGEQNLWVFSGVDGVARLRDNSHYSCTGFENPVIVDVDRDGQVEIVVVDYNGVRVLGDASESWVSARSVWNQHAYSITNINDDLSIPSYAESNWPIYNNFRSGDIRVNNGSGANQSDVFPLITDVCEIECDRNQLEFTVQVGNEGLADYFGDVVVQIYHHEDGIDTPLTSITFSQVLIRSGFSTAGEVFRIDLADIPSGHIVVSVDDTGDGSGVIEECDEEDNRFVLENFCAQIAED